MNIKPIVLILALVSGLLIALGTIYLIDGHYLFLALIFFIFGIVIGYIANYLNKE